ncbi:YqaJ viral recombinase family protein [Oceanobacillus jeddahense]|uniref:YqaJ viral recombinase family protein n=1 Tax=Oceanobacillus jeddahense TaxID=1462527 RepID=UPI0005962BC6|nr:YqaJ viral recombinase family protein [Oceanobacillus jeddahense]
MNNLLTQADDNVTKKRNMYCGGSDVPTILGLNKYKTQFELAQEKTGIKPSEFKGNEYTQFGNALEPQIRDYINGVNETLFVEKTIIDEEKNIRSNVDGFDADYGLLLEIKTHGKNPTLKVYESQMHLYMWHLDIKHAWLALYERPDDFDTEFDAERLQIKEINRDEEYVQKILDAIETFWIRCEALKDNPKMTEQEFLDYGQNDVAVFANQVSKLEMKLAGFKELEKQYEKARKDLHDAMEAYDIKKYETDVVTITRVLPGEKRQFDSKTFKADYPELSERYQKVSKTKGSVRIKVKEA